MELTYLVEKNCPYKTIDEVLKLYFHFSTRLRTKLINLNQIFLNGLPSDTRNTIVEKDCITVSFCNEEDTSNMVPNKMDISIIYEDEWFLAVNKPAGIAIHPSLSHYNNSLSNGVRSYFDSIGLKKKVRPINRLDFDTSGLALFAKCEYIQDSFSIQMQEKEFRKNYLALVEGSLKEKQGTISLPIARKPGSIIEREVNSSRTNFNYTLYCFRRISKL